MYSKKVSRIFIAVLCLIFASMPLFGCGKGGNTVTLPKEELVEGGLHQINVTQTSKEFIKDGKSDYKIVVSKDMSSVLNAVVNDMVKFIREATGAELQVITDEGITLTADSKYIVIGQNDVYDQTTIEYTRSELQSNGYKIVTKDNSIFLGGVTEFGDSNAVYEFLAHTINYKAYNVHAFLYDENTTVNLPNFDIKERPDFEWRRFSSGSMNSPNINMRRMRFNDIFDCFVSIDGNDVHNFYQIANVDKDGTDHPKWFSVNNSGRQICMLAQGDKAERDLLMERVFEKFKKEIINQPTKEIVSFTQNDNDGWCNCDACQESLKKYGSNSASLIQFCNELSDKIQAWIKDNDDGVPADRKMQICFFAYQYTESAPVKLKDGAYVPTDPSVVCNPEVTVFIAPLSASYVDTFESSVNKVTDELFKSWEPISQTMYLWMYQTNYTNYIFPYNSFNTMPENYRYAFKKGTTFIFNQGQYGQALSTGFNELKVYIDSKLQWNVNLNMQDLIDDYFDGAYLEASEPMQAYFDDLNTWLAEIHSNPLVAGGVYVNTQRVEYWPYKKLEGFINNIDKAYAAIEKYKLTDPSLYNQMCERICMESIFPRYAIATLHDSYFSTQAISEYKSELSNDIIRLGISLWKEGKDISDILSSWN